MAERCLELHGEIEEAHAAYMRCAKRNAANLILSDLHDRLARLLGNSLLRVRDHTPREMDRNFRCTGEIIPVQEWMAIAGMTQPLAQRCERNGSIVPKETVAETVRSNLAELRARRNDEHGLSVEEIITSLDAKNSDRYYHDAQAVRCAPLQEIAETVSRVLAYLTDRLIWPSCLPMETFSKAVMT